MCCVWSAVRCPNITPGSAVWDAKGLASDSAGSSCRVEGRKMINKAGAEGDNGGEMTEEALPKKTLVWHKLPVGGFIPSGREGHSSVGANMKMYIFGGMETGRRVNTMQVLDIATGHWSNNVVGNRDLRIDAEIHKGTSAGNTFS